MLVLEMVLEVSLAELLATLWTGNLDRTLVLVLGDLCLSTLVSVHADAVSEHIAFALELVIAAALSADILLMSVTSYLRFCFFGDFLAFCLQVWLAIPW